jgi:hypothetical protein
MSKMLDLSLFSFNSYRLDVIAEGILACALVAQAILPVLFGFLRSLRVSDDATCIVILRPAPLLQAGRRISPVPLPFSVLSVLSLPRIFPFANASISR